MELIKGRPETNEGRLEKEIRVYDLLDSLNIPYERIDHEAAETMEACAEIDKALAPAVICKNLFLCNSQKTKFYLLMIREDKKFKTKDINILITTSILERGITVENLQVIIFMANHPLFNNQNLTQIAGRVGRKTKYPDGDVYYLANESNSEIEKSINNINEANKHL